MIFEELVRMKEDAKNGALGNYEIYTKIKFSDQLLRYLQSVSPVYKLNIVTHYPKFQNEEVEQYHIAIWKIWQIIRSEFQKEASSI